MSEPTLDDVFNDLSDEFSIVIGVKSSSNIPTPPLISSSNRTEYNIITGEFTSSITFSRKNFEIVGLSGTADTTDLLANIDFNNKFLGAKIDVFSHGSAGALVGGSVNLSGDVGARIGIGSTDGNVYVEIEGNVFTISGLAVAAIVTAGANDNGYLDAGIYDGGRGQNPGYWSDTGYISAPDGAVDEDGNILSKEQLTEALEAETLSFQDVIDMINQAGNNLAKNAIASVIKNASNNCFLAGTQITMHDGSSKNIEDISPDDIVISYDETGKLVPGRVTKTFQHQVKHILNVHGLMVTPGHVTLCGEGAFKGQHVPMIDIIRSDSAVVKTDGTLVRVNTNCAVDTYEDQFVLLAIGEMGTDGLHVRDQGRVRIGMRFILPDGRDMSIAEILAASGATVNADGLVDSKTMPEPTPLHLSFLEAMPQVEDYILARSGLSLDEIYDAGEWEATRPQMPPPLTVKKQSQNAADETTVMADADVLRPPILH